MAGFAPVEGTPAPPPGEAPPPAPPHCDGEGSRCSVSPSPACGRGGWGAVGRRLAEGAHGGVERAGPRSTRSAIVPWLVNLAAFESRLKSVCRTLVRSACI